MIQLSFEFHKAADTRGRIATEPWRGVCVLKTQGVCCNLFLFCFQLNKAADTQQRIATEPWHVVCVLTDTRSSLLFTLSFSFTFRLKIIGQSIYGTLTFFLKVVVKIFKMTKKNCILKSKIKSALKCGLCNVFVTLKNLQLLT